MPRLVTSDALGDADRQGRVLCIIVRFVVLEVGRCSPDQVPSLSQTVVLQDEAVSPRDHEEQYETASDALAYDANTVAVREQRSMRKRACVSACARRAIGYVAWILTDFPDYSSVFYF
jgi:hypothetical protein